MKNLGTLVALRRCIVGVVSLGVAGVGVAGCESQRGPADRDLANEAAVKAATQGETPAAPLIVFLGDSLTAGLGLSESEALPARIQERIERAGLGYRVINAGRSGDTTAGGLARLDWYFREGSNVRAIVIGLGSNDAMRGLALDSVEENLRQIIRKVHEKSPSAEIFLWALETFPNMGKEYVDAYREIFPRVASSENAKLLPFPLEDVAGHPEFNQEDGIHPNAAGTEKVAERIWGALRPVL